MGTVILNPQDPMVNQFDARHQISSDTCNPNPRSRSHRRKRSLKGTSRLSSEKSHAKPLVMGKVRILKRGEDLKPKEEVVVPAAAAARDGDKDLLLCSTDRLGPDPKTVCEQVRVSDLYVTPASFPSPEPSSLPFPGRLIRGGV